MSDYGKPLAGKRCLVLDDEFMIALDIQQILESAGAADVVCVADSAAALKLIGKGTAFDFAVLDVKLGAAQTSLTVASRLATQGTPFVFLTGMRPDDLHRGEFPTAPTVEKPYQVSLLIEAAVRALRGAGTK